MFTSGPRHLPPPPNLIADQHNPAAVRRLVKALEARAVADERQDRLEAEAQASRKRKR